MISDYNRNRIIEEAKTWIGTPYRGWSCVKGAGVDCGQLLYGVFHAIGLLPTLELPKDYSLQISKHRASTEYLDIVDKFFDPIPESAVKPGDLVVYKLGLAFTHAAIVVEYPRYVIQAEARHGVSGTHATKNPAFRHAERVFRTLRGN